MHCHLKPFVPPVIFGFNHGLAAEDRNATAYQISAKSVNARLRY